MPFPDICQDSVISVLFEQFTAEAGLWTCQTYKHVPCAFVRGVGAGLHLIYNTCRLPAKFCNSNRTEAKPGCRFSRSFVHFHWKLPGVSEHLYRDTFDGKLNILIGCSDTFQAELVPGTPRNGSMDKQEWFRGHPNRFHGHL